MIFFVGNKIENNKMPIDCENIFVNIVGSTVDCNIATLGARQVSCTASLQIKQRA